MLGKYSRAPWLSLALDVGAKGFWGASSPRLEMDGWARACPRLFHCPGPEFPRPQLVSEVAGCRGTNALTAPAAQTPSHSPQLEEGTESPCGEGTGPPWVIVQPALQMWGAVRASRVRAFLLCGNAEGTWVSSETCRRAPH